MSHDQTTETPDAPVSFGGQVVLVTGGGRGLGAGYARLLAQRGAIVVIHDAGVEPDGSGGDPSVAEATAAEICATGGTATATTANLLDAGACESLIDDTVERHGHLDALVHNAGVVLWEDPDDPDDDIWRQTMSINAGAAFRLVRRALPHMRARGYGRIVLTTSGRATQLHSAVPGLVAYSAAKMAVYGLMVGFKANLPNIDVHLNAISPVAATRVLVRDAPELTVESVAPGAALLASAATTTSGLVLTAAGGRFRLDGWHQGPTLDLGPAPTVESLRQSWTSLTGDG